jgi:hypothetical protein
MAMTPDDRQDIKQGLKLDLVAGALRSRGAVHLKAWGMSMLPAIWPGDTLTIQGAAYEEIVPGDIVLVLRDNRIFIHRLVEKLSEKKQGCALPGLITKGDSVPHCDPAATASDLLGRVIGISRANRSFVPRQQISRAHSSLAWVLCRSARFRSLALRVHALTSKVQHPDGKLFRGSSRFSLSPENSPSRGTS